MHTVRNTKLNYNKMNKVQNPACDFKHMVKVKGAGDVPRKATVGFEGLAGRMGISKWETSFGMTVARRSWHARGAARGLT